VLNKKTALTDKASCSFLFFRPFFVLENDFKGVFQLLKQEHHNPSLRLIYFCNLDDVCLPFYVCLHVFSFFLCTKFATF